MINKLLIYKLYKMLSYSIFPTPLLPKYYCFYKNNSSPNALKKIIKSNRLWHFYVISWYQMIYLCFSYLPDTCPSYVSGITVELNRPIKITELYI